jgi:hypothetical protein
MKTVHHFILSSCMRQRYLLALAAALLVFIQQPAAQISEGGVPYTFLTRGLGPAARYSMNVTLKNPPRLFRPTPQKEILPLFMMR